MKHTNILIHGYAGKDLSFWLQDLEQELGENSQVYFPAYKNSKEPVMDDWLSLFDNQFNKELSYSFISHSMGCLVAFKLIEKHEIDVENAVLVACPVNQRKFHSQLLDKLDEDINKKIIEFVEHKYDWHLITSKIQNLTFFFSDDDFAIPYPDSLEFYQDKFPRADFKIFHKYGHFNRKSEIYKLPQVLKVLDIEQS